MARRGPKMKTLQRRRSWQIGFQAEAGEQKVIAVLTAEMPSAFYGQKLFVSDSNMILTAFLINGESAKDVNNRPFGEELYRRWRQEIVDGWSSFFPLRDIVSVILKKGDTVELQARWEGEGRSPKWSAALIGFVEEAAS